jgi:hypothetical protein
VWKSFQENIFLLLFLWKILFKEWKKDFMEIDLEMAIIKDSKAKPVNSNQWGHRPGRRNYIFMFDGSWDTSRSRSAASSMCGGGNLKNPLSNNILAEFTSGRGGCGRRLKARIACARRAWGAGFRSWPFAQIDPQLHALFFREIPSQ